MVSPLSLLIPSHQLIRICHLEIFDRFSLRFFGFEKFSSINDQMLSRERTMCLCHFFFGNLVATIKKTYHRNNKTAWWRCINDAERKKSKQVTEKTHIISFNLNRCILKPIVVATMFDGLFFDQFLLDVLFNEVPHRLLIGRHYSMVWIDIVLIVTVNQRFQ